MRNACGGRWGYFVEKAEKSNDSIRLDLLLSEEGGKVDGACSAHTNGYEGFGTTSV